MSNPTSPASWTEIDHDDDDVTPVGCNAYQSTDHDDVTPVGCNVYQSTDDVCGKLSDEILSCDPPTPVTASDSDIYAQCITWVSDVLWAMRHPTFTTSRCTVAVTDITDHKLSSGKTSHIYDKDAADDAWSDRFNSIINITDEPLKSYDPTLNTIMRVSAGSRFAFDADRVLEVHGGLVFAWCQVGGGNITTPVWVLVAIRTKVAKEDSALSRFLNLTRELFGSEEKIAKRSKRKRSGRCTPDYSVYDTCTLYAVSSTDEDIRSIITQNTIPTNTA